MHCVLKCVYRAWCNVNGIELNFISFLCNFKIYIQGKMLLPMILVRNQMKNTLGGETDRFTGEE